MIQLRLPHFKQMILHRHRKKSPISRKFVVFILILFGLIFACLSFLVPLFKDLPSPSKLKGQDYPVSTKIFDRHGTLLYEIFADLNRTPIALKDLPPSVFQASIAIEDQEFYSHFGFSLQGILRASKNIIFKNKLQGGSTITQQLVKTALLQNPERTLRRKLREAILTIATEIRYSKDEILELYLNHIPYGGTAYGIEAAAQRYFGKPATTLNLAEAALLAGLPQAPTRYSPFTNPEAAKARQFEVLRRMVEDGYISQAESDLAYAAPLNYISLASDIRAPHFVFYLKDLLVDRFGLDEVEKGGLRVTSTLDLTLQDYVQSSVSAEIDSLSKYQVGNGAVLVTKPNTGEILAMVGSKNYFNTAEDGQVNLTNRLRQPGSSIKPLNYVTALQLKKMTPATLILDYPTCFNVTGQTSYCPKNYSGGFSGPVSFRQALGNSLNIPAVKILAANSVESMIATASAMGITTFTDPERYGLSLTLGGGEVTMLDMATAFGTLANQGVKVKLQPILKITDYQGNVLSEFQPEHRLASLADFFNEDNSDHNQLYLSHNDLTRVLNREPAFLIDHILADNNARSAVFGSNSQLVIKQKTVSVKTGTTNDLKDNWTIGFTPEYLVAAWVGNNDATPMNPYLVSGITGAAPIWHDVMTYLLKDANDQPQPQPLGVKAINVCSLSGSYAQDNIPCDGKTEYFWDQNLPTGTPVERKSILVFKDTDFPATIADDPNNPPDPNLLETKEHLIASDGFAFDWCLDCAYPANEKGNLQYPRTTVNMNSFIYPPPKK